jgi:hypothetical protein
MSMLHDTACYLWNLVRGATYIPDEMMNFELIRQIWLGGYNPRTNVNYGVLAYERSNGSIYTFHFTK